MKIYVASSWRNDIQPAVVEALRKDGYEVYDFKNPKPGNHGFHWSEIDPIGNLRTLSSSERCSRIQLLTPVLNLI